jgi:hypothetical protein
MQTAIRIAPTSRPSCEEGGLVIDRSLQGKTRGAGEYSTARLCGGRRRRVSRENPPIATGNGVANSTNTGEFWCIPREMQPDPD